MTGNSRIDEGGEDADQNGSQTSDKNTAQTLFPEYVPEAHGLDGVVLLITVDVVPG